MTENTNALVKTSRQKETFTTLMLNDRYTSFAIGVGT
jgi:hypothetical protein